MKTSRQSPVDALRAISDLVENLTSGRQLADESRELLRDGLKACVASQFETCLFTVIGLKGRGGISLGQRRRLADRDALLVHLWRTCDEYRGLPAIAASKSMVVSLQRYHVTRWPRERHGCVPASEPAATWWRILSEDVRVPASKRLQQILESFAESGAASNTVRMS